MNLLYIGNVEPDPEEQEFVKEHSIQIISGHEITQNLSKTLEKIEIFMAKYEHIHISFDIDVFHSDLVSATGTPALDGLSIKQIFPILEMLKTKKHRSYDLVEVNPEKIGAEKTIILARKVLEILGETKLNNSFVTATYFDQSI